jgi:preprotein translocase subunit YajC
METNWFIIALVLVLLVALVIYLILRNQKDEEEVTESINETDIDDEEDSIREKMKDN